ncbi:SRPBCC family protein [Phyllobacterium sp. K27]
MSLIYELDAAPTKVWRALTIPEYVSQWLGGSDSSDGGHGPVEDSFELHLISAEPDTSVRYSIKDNEAVSTVTFQINANGKGGTTFRIVHEQSMVAANCNLPRRRHAA